MKEIWKEIKGYNGQYQVSNYGRIKSSSQIITRIDGVVLNYSERILTPTDNGSGYKIVGLGGRKHRKNHYIHRLVAEAFIPNEKKLPEVNHKDEDKGNNTTDNLEWCDRTYNATYGTVRTRQAETMKRKYKSREIIPYYKGKSLSIQAKNKMSSKAKLRGKRVTCKNTGETFINIKAASERFDVCPETIRDSCYGKRKTRKGLVFMFE